MPDAIRKPVRRLRKSGTHQPDEVGFDLEIYIVRMGTISGTTGKRRKDSSDDVSATDEVRVPERSGILGERLS
jgi:hypothetical protein